MVKNFVPTKEPQKLNGNTIYINDNGEMVVEHISGAVIVTDGQGNTTTTKPNGVVIEATSSGQFTITRTDGIKTILYLNGTSDTLDANGNQVHFAAAGQNYSMSKDGDIQI